MVQLMTVRTSASRCGSTATPTAASAARTTASSSTHRPGLERGRASRPVRSSHLMKAVSTNADTPDDSPDSEPPARVSTKPVLLEWLVEHRNADRGAMAKLTKDELWQHIEPTEHVAAQHIRPNQQRKNRCGTTPPTPENIEGGGCESEMTYVTTFLHTGENFRFDGRRPTWVAE